MLAELAELDLALARRVHARAMAAEDIDDINSLSRTYQRVARSLRQTLALKARLERDRQAGLARRAGQGKAFDAAAVGRRMVELRDAVTRIGWSEYEPSALEDLAGELEEILGVLAFEPGFAERPLADQVVELCEKLELPTRRARGWRNLPQPRGLAEPGAYVARALDPAPVEPMESG